MTEIPAPLTPVECDLRDFSRMMIDISRLRTSVFDSTLDDAAWRAGLNLWMSAFHSVPAGALEDDEGVLCKASGLNRDVKTWRKVRAAAMRGFVKCSDGRWYHETVAEFVLEAWLEKLAHRLSSGAGNAKRWGITFDPEPIKTAIANAALLLTTLNPASKAIPKASRYISRPDPGGMQNQSRPDDKIIQPGSQYEGTEKGQGQGSIPIADAIRRDGAGEGDPAGKPEWWPKRDRYGRVLGDVTDKLLFDVGKAVLGKSAGGQITKLKKTSIYGRDWRAALELLLRADDTAEPAAWFAKALHRAEMDEPLDPMHAVYPEKEYRA